LLNDLFFMNDWKICLKDSLFNSLSKCEIKEEISPKLFLF
jgi:hypothetical protein